MSKTFTCNDCGTTGSLTWMSTHPCDTVKDIAEFGGRCEDYPCCGHLGADTGCAPQESHTQGYWANNPHLMCDHEAGVCDAYDDEPDLDDEDVADSAGLY